MKCQRCGKNEGEYLCSVCNRVVCSDCKVIKNGKVYCLDDIPKVPEISSSQSKEIVQNEVAQEGVTQSGATQERPKPKIFKILKELIYTDLIFLIGVIIIYAISNFFISGLLTSNVEIISKNLPQLGFLFVLLEFFESAGKYIIIILFIILMILIIIFVVKKRRYKNI